MTETFFSVKLSSNVETAWR